MTYDLIVRGGRIADGSGLPAYRADVAIKGNRIARIGRIAETARHEIDAGGRIVAPGFIDPHTHFDAQLLWDGYAKPALSHGVTTIVPGNCSLSLAPLKAEHRMKLVGMFNQIEEMPLKAFRDGVVWDWETFSEYIARIRKGLAINVAPLVGHSVMRLWVMGDAAMERTATPPEMAAMQACCANASMPARSVCRRAMSTWTKSCSRCRAAMRTRLKSMRSPACSENMAACCRSCRNSTIPT